MIIATTADVKEVYYSDFKRRIEEEIHNNDYVRYELHSTDMQQTCDFNTAYATAECFITFIGFTDKELMTSIIAIVQRTECDENFRPHYTLFVVCND